VFKFKNEKELPPHALDERVEDAIKELAGLDNGTEAYDNAVKNVATLMNLRRQDLADRKRFNVDHDVAAAIAGQLAGIVMILTFEKANIVTSKALMLIPRVHR
jgi:hypothetical protein